MKRFSLPRPRSINALVLIGYGCILVPLAIALVWAVLQLDRYISRSETLLLHGVDATQNSRRVREQLSTMERIARQYQLSQDAELLSFLTQDASTVREAVDALRGQSDDTQVQLGLMRISRNTDAFMEAITNQESGSERALNAISDFPAVISEADKIHVLLNNGIDEQLAGLRQDAARTRATLLWQAIALAVISTFTMLFVTWRVSRPIRALDRAISQLGEGRFSRPIRVDGPADLVALGIQLEWLRARLLELAQEKNRFLRHMSHELKTPLANIREGTELLLDGAVGDLQAPQLEVTDILRSNGIKLQRLIENLLNFSAWQTRNEVLACSDIPLTNVVQSVLQSHALTIRGQQIRLLLQLGDISLYADREMIRTVLDNLISNAIKFSPQGAALMVRTTLTPDGVCIEVADQGPGIPMRERKKVFDAFYQGEQTQGGLVAGTGIGLSVVLECVQAHDGFVDITDEQQEVQAGDGEAIIFTGAHMRIIIPQKFTGEGRRQAANG